METFLGIGLTCIGSIADAVGFVVQKKGHNQVQDKNEISEITGEGTYTLFVSTPVIALQ